MFTFNTFKTKAWSASYQSVSVHEAKLKSKAQAIVAAISEDLGFEHFLLNLKSISTETFVEFLE